MIIYLLFLLLRTKTGCMKRNFTSFISEIRVSVFEHRDLYAWFSFYILPVSSPPLSVPDLQLTLSPPGWF
jgi:hypothetical protein